MTTWIVKLLGRFQLKDDANTAQLLHNQDAVRLLAYLLYFHQRSHLCNQLAEVLWPNLDEVKRSNVLQTSLESLYRQFSEAQSPVITCQDDSLSLDIRYFNVDIISIRALIQQARSCSEPRQRLGYLMSIVQSDYGLFLSQIEDDWIVSERLQLHTLYLTTLHHLVESCLTLNKLSAAIAYAHLAVKIEPYSEQAHLDLIRAYIARGYHASAQRQYSAFIHIFSQELKRSVSAVASELAQRFNLCQPVVTFL